MDIAKLQQEVAALVASQVKKSDPKPAETRKMTVEQFGVYADEQVKKAKGEADAGKPELSKKRLEALKAEVDKLTKYEYKTGELPTVTVYKDPEQLETTEEEVPLSAPNVPDNKSNWTAKSQALAGLLAEAITDLSNRPTDKRKDGEEAPPPPPTSPRGDIAWPNDLAKSVRPDPRSKDADYDWGKDVWGKDKADDAKGAPAR